MKLISKKTLLLFFLPGAIFMGAFLIYPIFKMVFDSFFKVGITGARTFIGFDNYIKAFTAGGFLKQLKNTLIYILIAVSVETVLGFIFALLFELDYKGSKIVRSLMMTPLMIAPLVAGLIWKLMMSSNFGIVNEFLTRIGILSSPSEILWLACHIILLIFYIKIPGIKPVLLTALSVRIIDAAKTFDIIWAMTEGGPNSSSETISIIIYKTLVKYNNTGYASAMAVIFIIVLVVFTLVFMQSLWNPKKK